jgi:hypothetical protein
MAASITYTITGTLGPILSGTDPLGANGKTGTITIVVSETLKPKKHTATSATYTLPADAITVNIGGTNYGTTGTSTLVYSIPSAGPDTMVVTATVVVDDIFSGTVVGTASLAKGSFPSAVLKHPHAFSPASQTLTAATTATGQGSKVKYTALGSSTVLGLSGTASD